MTLTELLKWLREAAAEQESDSKQYAGTVDSQAHNLGLTQGAAIAYGIVLGLVEGCDDNAERLATVARAYNHFCNGTDRGQQDVDALLEAIGSVLEKPF